MYTSYIGKQFLKVYNQKENTNYSAEDFFDKIMFPLFFDNDKHLMHVGNSPFFQKPKPEDIALYGSKSKAQYNNFKNAISKDKPNGSILVGAEAKEIINGSTGQTTDILFNIDKEDVYASWIGGALGLGVAGGQSILINKQEVLLFIYEGWKVYRNYLEQTPNLKDKQIDTWNGKWFSHLAKNKFNLKKAADNINFELASKGGNLSLETEKWTNIFFGLSKLYKEGIITGYCYGLGQMNTTLGFINFYLSDINKMYELNDILFGGNDETILTEEEIQNLTSRYFFKDACALGTIGLKAIEPKGLRKYMYKNKDKYEVFKFKDKESYKEYNIFKIWIIAMLNKKELLNSASQIANILVNIEQDNTSNNRGKTQVSQDNKNILEAKGLKMYIEGLSSILNKLDDTQRTIVKNNIEECITLPYDLFPLYMTLVRFEYNYIKK